MLLFSFVFLASAYYFTMYLGSVGFILANALNMVARIIHRYDMHVVKNKPVLVMMQCTFCGCERFLREVVQLVFRRSSFQYHIISMS